MKNLKFKELGKFLKLARKASGITQRDVAKKMGYSSPQFISNCERGLCAPSRESLPILVDLYKINKIDLIHLLIDIETNSICSLFSVDPSEVFE